MTTSAVDARLDSWPKEETALAVFNSISGLSRNGKVPMHCVYRTYYARAGSATLPAQPRMSVQGGRALIVWEGPLWEQLGDVANLPRISGASYIPASMLPPALAKEAMIVAGPGYLLVASTAEVVNFLDHIYANSKSPRLPDALQTEDAPLPRVKALGYKVYQVSKYQQKNARFVDLLGNIWEAVGMTIGDNVEVTCYADGVKFTKAGKGTSTIKLAKSTRNREDRTAHTCAFRRIGESVLQGVTADTVRVLFTEDSLYLLHDRTKLSDFGLTPKKLYTGLLPLKDGEVVPLTGKKPPNYSIYPLKRKEPRVQVHGEWLAKFGFEPGVRFFIERHPLFNGRLLVRLDPEGDAQVTRVSQEGGAKLYVPTKLLEHFNKASAIRVWGNFEGLHIQRYYGDLPGAAA